MFAGPKPTPGTLVHVTDPDAPSKPSPLPGTWTVKRANARTATLTQGERTASVDWYFIVPGASAEAEPPAPIWPGTVVTVRAANADGLWVVTGETAKGYRLSPLGGSARYLTGLPAERLTVVAPSAIAGAL